ncbi:NUDIX hydrolase [Dermabacter sp. HSID17554]|uniref:NUDIX hydrolase n=1 Tax=Dermabacter sp. HSID17554 TaxID=2419511 RepID=UPI000F870A79|nr:NUDIX hydrolase [Dermabacter sp. HSID17554]RUP86675.1 NUDIX hydrolase [Dermabacter sp. HSID17554]
MAREQSPILAAGALVWREKRGKLQVLLVHRPKYDDWSIPKGKLEPGESFVAAAVREVEEETGYRIRLDRPLPTVDYRTHGRPKTVRYWAAQVRAQTGPGPKNPKEIDRVEWVAVSKAREILTRKSDRDLLKRVLDFADHGELSTTPVIVQRHAAAQSRAKWRKGDEKTRPLRRKGRKQAAALPPLLGAYAPKSVVTSPWRRCLETIEPFALEGGIDIVEKPELTEHAHAKRPARAAAVMERAIAEAARTVVCTHRPVLPTVIAAAKNACAKEVRGKLPRENPYLAPGEMLVLHTTERGRIVDVERHLPNIG